MVLKPSGFVFVCCDECSFVERGVSSGEVAVCCRCCAVWDVVPWCLGILVCFRWMGDGFGCIWVLLCGMGRLIYVLGLRGEWGLFAPLCKVVPWQTAREKVGSIGSLSFFLLAPFFFYFLLPC